jgi:hypothetical protein
MNNNLKKFFKENLEKNGFKHSKKRNTWFKINNKNTFFIIYLQKSNTSNKFYFNIGISYLDLKQLSYFNVKNPNWDETNTSSRAEMYIEDYTSPLKQLMLGGVYNDSQIKSQKKVYDYIIGFFNENDTKEKFKKNYEKYYLLDNVEIEIPLKEYCEN